MLGKSNVYQREIVVQSRHLVISGPVVFQFYLDMQCFCFDYHYLKVGSNKPDWKFLYCNMLLWLS